MFNAEQLRDLVIKPVLNDLVMNSDDAVELLMFTCAAESLGGTYLKQVNGDALGIYQMEPRTHNDIWISYIISKNDLVLKLLHNFGIGFRPSEERLIYDLRYATAMARIFYSRFKMALPHRDDPESIWQYYKLFYNTPAGKATKDETIKKYLDFTQSLRGNA